MPKTVTPEEAPEALASFGCTVRMALIVTEGKCIKLVHSQGEPHLILSNVISG